MPKHLIVAGNFHEARNHALEKGYTPRAWSYVDCIDRMRGLRNVTIEFVGTWRERPNYEIQFILDEARIMQRIKRAKVSI